MRANPLRSSQVVKAKVRAKTVAKGTAASKMPTILAKEGLSANADWASWDN